MSLTSQLIIDIQLLQMLIFNKIISKSSNSEDTLQCGIHITGII